jgi:N-acetylglutamate synthase-like GNAT family acetyltransferase
MQSGEFDGSDRAHYFQVGLCMEIRAIEVKDYDAALAIINQAAQAYRGVIPADRWHEPYMSRAEFDREISAGVLFWIAEDDGRPVGVMGIQDKSDVALVRHAYVVPTTQRKGVGTRLLRHVTDLSNKPILIGTWADAAWAIDFYQRNGFRIVSDEQRNMLLRKYWSIPERQIETSVVLANSHWVAT